MNVLTLCCKGVNDDHEKKTKWLITVVFAWEKCDRSIKKNEGILQQRSWLRESLIFKYFQIELKKYCEHLFRLLYKQ